MISVPKRIVLLSTNRVAKCHEYDGYIRVKIFAGWVKSLGEDAIWPNLAFFGKISTIMQDFYVQTSLI